MEKPALNHACFSRHPFFLLPGVLALVVAMLGLPGISQAQTPITPSGLHTVVTTIGNVHDITGGTRPGGASGTNLFHSFGDFNVPTKNIANFLNSGSIDLSGALLPPNLPTSNILARVTDVNPSTIFGTIQTNGTGGFGNANLFLINPHGFLFGPNASMNVGGMVTFTTADYLRLSDGVLFNKTPNVTQDMLLTAMPVAAFGFLGSNTAAIAIQGTTLQMAQGQTLSFIGGNQGFTYMDPDTGNIASVPGGVTMAGGKLSAPGGQINLASVASAGEILSSNLQLGANVNGGSFTSLGSITIGQDAHIDTSGATGGTIAIRGGQLTIKDGATIATAASVNPPAPAGSVTINGAGVRMTGSDVVINGTNVSVTGSNVTAANLDGSGGTIAITAGSADHPGNVTVAQNALLDASGTRGGSITIRGKQLVVGNATISADTGNADGAPIAIDINVSGDLSISNDSAPAITAKTTGAGNAGEISLTSAYLTVKSASTAGAGLAMIDSHTSGTGQAGKVTITTGDIDAAGQVWFIDSGTAGAGNGNDLAITAKNIRLNNMEINTGDFRAINQLNSDVTGSGGNLKITADSLDLLFHSMTTQSFGGQAGNMILDVGDITIRSGSFLGTTGLNGSGAVTINANRLIMDNSAQIEAETVFAPGGDITINAKVVELTTGSTIRTQTSGNADAGNILVTATDHVLLADGFFASRPSGFYSNSLSEPDVPLDTLGGKAGSINVNTPRLEMLGGARITSATETSGRGGDIIITANSISLKGERSVPIAEDFFNVGLGGTSNSGGIFSGTVGSEFCSGSCGDAGHVSIATGALAMRNGSMLDSSTSSTGNGGMITINATSAISLSGVMSNGNPVGIFSRTIGTTPDAGSGGNVSLTAGQSVTISDRASVSASSKGPGNTGNIQINAGNLFEMTNHSSVTTEADHASGGAIKISTTPNGTVQLTDSKISASVLDGTGGGGSVNIDPQLVLLLNSQILAQAVQGPGGNISITTNFLLPDANSTISASSQFGTNGTVTIQSPNAPISGQIQPLGKSPLLATSLLNQHCAALAGGEFSSFTVAGRNSLPTEPGSWLTSSLAFGSAGFSAGSVAEAGAQARVIDPTHESTVLSLRQIAPAGFLTQAFAVDWLASCQS